MILDYSQLNEKDFFNQLLQDAGTAYSQCDVIKLNSNWSYSVCGTPIIKKQGVILGLNWGGGKSENFAPQNVYPAGDDIEKYPFIMKIRPFLKEHLHVQDIKTINYSNLCFFRSPKVQDLTEGDWDCSRHLIQKYITYIEPAWILFLSTNIDQAIKSLELEFLESPKVISYKTYTAYRGISKITGQKIPFYALPHPNARLQYNIRQQLWNLVLPIKTSDNG